ncbi:hypothetical protein V8J88_20145 [Massilia sp. W12]|uniref:hypothetical protein n=1 Tax=Massilia sp. W12 TaxID=3126507 RepID=UPI0030CEFDAF
MSFFSMRVSPRWKLLLALMFVSMIATYTIKRSIQIQDEMEAIWEANNARLVTLSDMRFTLKAASRALEMYMGVLPPTPGVDLKKRYTDGLQQSQRQEEALLKQIKKQGTRKEESLMMKIAQDRKDTLELVHKLERMRETEPQAALELAKRDLRGGPMAHWQAALDEMISLQNESNTQAGSQAAAAWEQLRLHVLLMGGVVIVFGLFSLWWTFKRNAG